MRLGGARQGAARQGKAITQRIRLKGADRMIIKSTPRPVIVSAATRRRIRKMIDTWSKRHCSTRTVRDNSRRIFMLPSPVPSAPLPPLPQFMESIEASLRKVAVSLSRVAQKGKAAGDAIRESLRRTNEQSRRRAEEQLENQPNYQPYEQSESQPIQPPELDHEVASDHPSKQEIQP